MTILSNSFERDLLLYMNLLLLYTICASVTIVSVALCFRVKLLHLFPYSNKIVFT